MKNIIFNKTEPVKYFAPKVTPESSDDKLCPQILSVGTTANAALNGYQ
jgi:hypothetical protein